MSPTQSSTRRASAEPRQEDAPVSLRERAAAVALAAAALLLAAVAVGQLLAWQAARADLLQDIEDAGLAESRPELLDDIRYERSTEAARVAVARSLVHQVLALDSSMLGTDEARRRIENLPRIEELARRALEDQPGDWQAQMILGASIWLHRFYDRDPRLVTAYRDWEAPLLASVAGAEDQLEPRRVLVSAYLEIWRNLSPEKRQSATAMLSDLFADDLRSYRMLLPSWLRVERDPQRALAAIPPSPEAWTILRRLYSDRKSWTSFILAHDRLQSALEDDLTSRFAEAERRLRFGDYFHSREMFLRIVLDAPTERRFASLAADSLDAYPPGLHGLRSVGRLRGWIDWSLELSEVGLRGLPPSALAKLVDTLGSELEPEVAAHAAMVAGDAYQAERFSKLVDTFRMASAAPFFIARARAELAAGQDEKAEESLEQVQADARRGLAWATVRRDVARATGDVLAEAAAEEQLAEMEGPVYGASIWRWRRNRPTLDLVTRRPATGLRLQVADAPPDGAVIDVHFDGRSVSVRAVRQGDELLLNPLPVAVGSHLLEVRFLAGGQVVPGEVELVFGS